MQIFTTKHDLKDALAPSRAEGKSIGLVPTMGALHEGHFSLIRQALMHNHIVVVSLFVNPTQFGENEDFSTYPRTLEDDCAMLEKLGVHAVFAPTAGEMYDSTIEQMNAVDGGLSRTRIVPGDIAQKYEGALRPIHFSGVCLVINKLFNIVRPDRAYFGEKDYQQVAIVRQMVADLDIPVEISACPIERDDSGLALSSRNRYLTPAQRKQATCLYEAIVLAQSDVAKGRTNSADIIKDVVSYLTNRCPEEFKIGYVAIVDTVTLEPLAAITNEARLLISVELNGVHLIDNAQLCA